MSHRMPVNDCLKAHIKAPGAVFKDNALIIDADATEAELSVIGVLATQAEHSRAWWIGDWGVALQKRVGYRYTVGRAESLGISSETFVTYKGVAEFFPPESRVKGLNFFHHREAMHASRSVRGKRRSHSEWLAKSLAEKWTVSELRLAIRAELADYKADGIKPSANAYSALLDAERWATMERKELPKYTPARATAVLSDVPNLQRLLLDLQSLVDASNPTNRHQPARN